MTVAEGTEGAITATVTYRQDSKQQSLPVLFLKTKKANKVGVPAQTPQKTGFTIHFAYLKSSIEFQWDTILLFIYNPHTSRCAVRTAAAFQQASDAYSLHVTFYHIAHI